MSKQSEAKARQGYNPKPQQKICSTCAKFKSDLIKQKWGGFSEKKLRCGLGGFAVNKTGSCDEHEFPF